MDEQVLTFVLTLARVSAFIGFLPLFAQRQLPFTVKSGLATALTIFWFGSVSIGIELKRIDILLGMILIVKEIGVGILLSMVMGFMLIPARIAGSYIGQEIGISMEPVTNSGSEQTTIMASIFETSAILLFFALNLHHLLIMVLHYSMTDLAGKWDLLDLPTEHLVLMASRLTEKGLLIAAPIGVLGGIVLVTLFFLNRAAPTMNLFSVGMPLRIGLGLLGLALMTPVLWRSIEYYFQQSQREIEQLLNYFHL